MFESVTELLTKIRLGEDSYLELKSVTVAGEKLKEPHPDSVAQELTAFANSATGGVLILGVNDRSREIEGIPLDKLDSLERVIRNICNDAIDPPLDATIERIELPDRLGEMHALLKITVRRSLFIHRAPGGYFERIGSSKREINTQRLERLMQQRSQSRLILFDEQPVSKSNLESLDPQLRKRFIERSESSPIEVLEKLGILVRDAENELRCSVAGVLLATTEPEHLLHQGASIEAVHYSGEIQDSDMQVNARRITGPIDRQMLDAFAFVVGAMQRKATKQPARVEVEQFSRRAVFELIVNAVVHRDYSISGSRIRLFVFSDRLEIYSPGDLPNTLTVDTLAHRQFTRNETLVGLLGRLTYEINVHDAPLRKGRFLETRGDGIRIVLKEAEAFGTPPPVFELLDRSELKVTLWARS